MDAPTRFSHAMRRQEVDRPPVLPKIWIDLACALQQIEPVQVCRDARQAMLTVLDAALSVRADAVRLFLFPSRDIRQHRSGYGEFDARGQLLGEVDMRGGWMTDLAQPHQFMLTDLDWMAHNHFYPAGSVPYVQSVEQARSIVVPGPDYWQQSGYGSWVEEALARAGDQIGCIGDCDTPTLGFLATLRGKELALCDLLLEPELAHACFQKGTEISLARARFWLDHGVKNLRLNDSMANMNLISPDQWRNFIAPYFTQFCSAVHQYDRDAAVYCHICGNVLPILTDLVATGLDCIGPMDPLGGMTIAQARQVVGDGVALMGGVNTLSLLEGPVEKINFQSRSCVALNGDLPGYILGSGCVVPPGTPREHIAAMVQSVC